MGRAINMDQYRAQIQAEYQAREAQNAAARAARKVTIIYDTSYLMGSGYLVHPLFTKMAAEVVNVVPLQVQEEMDRLISTGTDERKRISATSGRKRFGTLLRETNLLGQEGRFDEPDLSHLTPHPIVGPLSHDSGTDGRLITYALQVAAGEPDRFVILATRDGGIQVAMERLAGRHPRLYCIDSADGQFINSPINAIVGAVYAVGR